MVMLATPLAEANGNYRQKQLILQDQQRNFELN
jgi:hypothetical protein